MVKRRFVQTIEKGTGGVRKQEEEEGEEEGAVSPSLPPSPSLLPRFFFSAKKKRLSFRRDATSRTTVEATDVFWAENERSSAEIVTPCRPSNIQVCGPSAM